MWLAAADETDRRWMHRGRIAQGIVGLCRGSAEEIIGRDERVTRRIHALDEMIVCRHFRGGDGMHLLSCPLSLGEPIAHVDRSPAPHVRQAEVRLPIATISGSEEREQGLILIDREKLPVALRPTLWGKVKRDDLNFTKKGSGHIKIKYRVNDLNAKHSCVSNWFIKLIFYLTRLF